MASLGHNLNTSNAEISREFSSALTGLSADWLSIGSPNTKLIEMQTWTNDRPVQWRDQAQIHYIFWRQCFLDVYLQHSAV